jgi:hypothetical protein
MFSPRDLCGHLQVGSEGVRNIRHHAELPGHAAPGCGMRNRPCAARRIVRCGHLRQNVTVAPPPCCCAAMAASLKHHHP